MTRPQYPNTKPDGLDDRLINLTALDRAVREVTTPRERLYAAYPATIMRFDEDGRLGSIHRRPAIGDTQIAAIRTRYREIVESGRTEFPAGGKGSRG